MQSDFDLDIWFEKYESFLFILFLFLFVPRANNDFSLP
jgi:hypothetical protein